MKQQRTETMQGLRTSKRCENCNHVYSDQTRTCPHTVDELD